ncbi:undecaprenyl-phosphate galactosephosphotransferase [Phenylobacterium zucineum HLK1]|uniref:Undecaprenyl-phosphate galactosephosphotransferase n=2 Tax=Phenylobacterium zucineum TaxID=284016 RepID=B4R832_PHEZH|nr:undecaprenyl-phosphate galactosephosphotransferase [Phenylobacterium zucineum HLK1]
MVRNGARDEARDGARDGASTTVGERRPVLRIAPELSRTAAGCSARLPGPSPTIPFARVLMSEIVFANPTTVRSHAPGLSLDGAATTTMNVTIALAAILFLAPLMIVVALLIYAQDGGPVVFAHKRLGRGGKHFKCLKFRSMAVDAEARLAELLARDPAARAEWEKDHKLRQDPRVTKLGAFLRKSSLDELPQLFNVLRGEMSLVGPRPIVDAEAAKYGRRFRHYCAVKPGITGLWQVSGRNDTSYRARVAMDCVYAARRNAMLDLKIMFATVPAVLLSRGSY